VLQLPWQPTVALGVRGHCGLAALTTDGCRRRGGGCRPRLRWGACRSLWRAVQIRVVGVPGVDEFALHKEHSYGTLLIGVSTRRPVDILDERRRSPSRCGSRPGRGLCDGGAGRVQTLCRSPTGGTCGTTLAKPLSERSPAPSAPVGRDPQHPPSSQLQHRHHSPARDLPRSGRIATGLGPICHGASDAGQRPQPPRGRRRVGLSRNTVRFVRVSNSEELLVHDGSGRRTSILASYEPHSSLVAIGLARMPLRSDHPGSQPSLPASAHLPPS
jgi:hypothetical protein